MSKHTAGPWTVSTSDRYVRYRGIHGPNICDLEVFGGERDEQEANAHLIAAAPELLEALKMAWEWEKDCPIFEAVCPKCQWKRKAQAAIRKAEGEL